MAVAHRFHKEDEPYPFPRTLTPTLTTPSEARLEVYASSQGVITTEQGAGSSRGVITTEQGAGSSHAKTGAVRQIGAGSQAYNRAEGRTRTRTRTCART